VVGAAYQQKDLAAAASSRFLTAPLLSRADEGPGPWLWPEIAASRQAVDRGASFDALWLLVFFVRRAALLSLTARRRMGALAFVRVQEPIRKYGAPSVHPNIPNSRRGRVASPHVQGREMDVFVGIDVSKDRLDICVRPAARPSSSRATTKVWSVFSTACALFIPSWSRSRRRAETRRRSRARFDGQARQDRSSGRRGAIARRKDRRLSTSIAHFAEAVRPPARPVANAQAQALGELVARRRQVIEMIVAEKNRRRLAGQLRVSQGHRSACRSPAGRAFRTRAGHRRRNPQEPSLASRRRSPGQRAGSRQGDVAHAHR
jgi:hypothetical protein